MFTVIVGICVGAVVLGLSIWGGFKLDSIVNSITGFVTTTGKSIVFVLFIVLVIVILVKLFNKIKPVEKVDKYYASRVKRKKDAVEYKEIKNRERYGKAQYKSSMKTLKKGRK